MSIRSATWPFPARIKTELQIDPVLLGLVLALLLGGFVILASASISISDNATNNPFFYVQRQLLAAVIGIVAGVLCLYVPMQVWRSLSPLVLLVGFALLIVVLIPGIGYQVNGSTRWVRVGIMNLQVSEPARLCFLMYLAGYLVRRNKALRDEFMGFLRPMIVLCLACILLLLEPDFGAAVVLLATALAMMFVAGARIRDFLVFIVMAVVAMVALAIASPYRMQRITGFLDPWADPYNSGFQLTQSLIAIGRGEWLGVGLGDSVQKLFYLPEAHTDFVFAVYAEEFGLLGSLVLIALFLALLWRIFNLATRAADAERFFEAYIAIGLGTWLGIQAFINIGVNMGLLPTKGLTLPLISYGRSSLIITLICMALLLRIHHELAVDAKPVNRTRRSRSRQS
ncbi:MAG: putative lipid II flippase FtsW [Gammaproteobacteria bacterium]|nr:putative lipid II flippase FtsW [Gammaproteobacteria bacterium]MDH5240962.1 putative lipid II flippase FtsW [Gammaproteobacteria bacterium]MDH5261929.1 putative lipid II flippase FtsW [Gammaproteobacteria bacterium]MDH5584319.1 putative lipid II flippase FtsW [Gammaproteobacteria bacterium]